MWFIKYKHAYKSPALPPPFAGPPENTADGCECLLPTHVQIYVCQEDVATTPCTWSECPQLDMNGGGSPWLRGQCVILVINHMCPLESKAHTNSTLGPSEQAVGASAPAGVPIRLSREFPREHPEVSLPCLRPKAVLGQGPAGQPRGWGVGAGGGQSTAGAPLLPPGFSASQPPSRRAWLETGLGSGEGTQAPGSGVSAPWALLIQELGSCLPPPHSSWRGAHRPPGSRGGD